MDLSLLYKYLGARGYCLLQNGLLYSAFLIAKAFSYLYSLALLVFTIETFLHIWIDPLICANSIVDSIALVLFVTLPQEDFIDIDTHKRAACDIG